ncbi:hypothetical protein TOPH_05788 [Tolypocladium ophioglossoides CBS 100239]|uniref:Uncharacterized protein n=1 Tax=Tolypocladium ophioglossoides (strain CBS 100239) TaxID=1163406 RepID=A0A0L0N659_TOLOC|nr:hypothetical protein TOPH_05788 [Tolypocladium ophioglossoides CBS 100239]
MSSSGSSPNANGSTGSSASRRNSPPKGLTVDTSNISISQGHNPMVASALLSARLTPSPHRSHFSTAMPGPGATHPPGEPFPHVVTETKNPFGQFRQDWTRQNRVASDRGLDSGVGLWQTEVRSAWDAPETYQAFVQGAPVHQQPNVFAKHSSEDDSSSLASSSFFDPAFAASANGIDYAHQRDASQIQPLVGSSFAPTAPPGIDVNSAHLSPYWFARPSLAPEGHQRNIPRLLGGPEGHQCHVPRLPAPEGHQCHVPRLLGPEQGRRASNAQAQCEGAFGTRQLREALPPVGNTRSAVKNARAGQSQSSGFLPMMAVTQPEKRRNSLAAMQLQASDSSRFSARYHGMHTESNASIDHLPNELNCALWLTNLPADIDYPELLRSVRYIGRVYCTFINYPDKIRHHTAAAKIVFFTPAAAQKLLAETWTKTLVIREHRVRASHNRIKTQETCTSGNKSRVLIITGSADFVNPANLRVWFGKRFQFHEDQFLELIKAGERVVWEFRFGSYRCQSQMGKISLEKDRPVGFEKVEFGDDPCELGETMASYGIAAERIQGKGLY